MNQYTEILTYLRELALQDPLVNAVTQGYFEDVDTNKMILFPLVHIQINDAQFTDGGSVGFNIQIGALNIRDISKEDDAKDYLKKTNEDDNYNEMLAILNRMWTKLYTDFDDADIVASANPTAEKVSNGFGKGLDGWIITFDVIAPNRTLSLCQY